MFYKMTQAKANPYFGKKIFELSSLSKCNVGI